MMQEGHDAKIVLVVEDDGLSRKLTADILELQGYRVVPCGDGPSALAYLHENAPPQLVLLDIGLPDMNGYEVFRRLRGDERLKPVKIVALSASTMKEDEIKVRAAGFDDFIPKPLDIPKFIQTVKRYLGA